MSSKSKYTTSVYLGKDLSWLIAGAVVIGILIGVVASCLVFTSAGAEGETEARWVICQPDSYLTIRERPKKTGGQIGQLYLGDRIETDGVKKDGFLHIVDASTESGDGWVYAAYLSENPVLVETYPARIGAGGRVAVRRFPGGKRIRWMKPGAAVMVYAWSADWCVTNRGFIQSDYLAGE